MHCTCEKFEMCEKMCENRVTVSLINIIKSLRHHILWPINQLNLGTYTKMYQSLTLNFFFKDFMRFVFRYRKIIFLILPFYMCSV